MTKITCRSPRRALPAGRRYRLDFERLELGRKDFCIIHYSSWSRGELVNVSLMLLRLSSRSRRVTKSLEIMTRERYVWQLVYEYWWLDSFWLMI